MHSTVTWDDLDKALVQAFVIEMDAACVDPLLYKVWQRRDISGGHWERLLQIAEGRGPLGSSCVIAWQDHDSVWHPRIDVEPRKLAELIVRAKLAGQTATVSGFTDTNTESRA